MAGKSEYLEKLKDPRWQKKRLEIFERDKWTCRDCEAKDKTLHVHHIIYIPGKDPWDIPSGFLVTLCEDCHNTKPCDPKYKSCNECPEYKSGPDGCGGPGNPNEGILSAISQLLDLIWREPGAYGVNYNTAICNAHLILK